MKRQIIILGIVLLAAGLTHGQECAYVESPWGVPCNVDADRCSMVLAPMFLGDNHTLHIRMITDIAEDEVTVDFTTLGPPTFRYEWDHNVRFVEWLVREPGATYEGPPAVACYCDEVRGVVVLCVAGKFDEEWVP